MLRLVLHEGDHIEDSVALGIVPEQVSRPCGWCKQPAWLRRRQAAQAGWEFGGSEYNPVIYAIYECSGCNRASLGIYRVFRTSGRWLPFPFSEFLPTANAVPMDIPHAEVEADRLEAWACYHAGQHRAAILMARSALQRAVRALHSFRGKLNGELDNLVTAGIITQQLRDNADEVRITGNDVAHPEELGSVSEEEATDSLTFLDDFIQTTIVIPERQRQREAARQADKP